MYCIHINIYFSVYISIKYVTSFMTQCVTAIYFHCPLEGGISIPRTGHAPAAQWNSVAWLQAFPSDFS